jgi:hypothetical protein
MPYSTFHGNPFSGGYPHFATNRSHTELDPPGDTEEEAVAQIPVGKTCGDCAYYEPTCQWLISVAKTNFMCDFIPVRFKQKPEGRQAK